MIGMLGISLSEFLFVIILAVTLFDYREFSDVVRHVIQLLQKLRLFYNKTYDACKSMFAGNSGILGNEEVDCNPEKRFDKDEDIRYSIIDYGEKTPISQGIKPIKIDKSANSQQYKNERKGARGTLFPVVRNKKNHNRKKDRNFTDYRR